MSAVFKFRLSITPLLQTQGLALGAWPGSTRRSWNVLVVSTTPKQTVLYVKESNTRRKFWGLTRNQVDRLVAADVRWFAVFLTNSDSGYLLSGGQVLRRIDRGLFELSHDGDYKINESPDLAGAQHFGSLDELAHRTL
jgi:hypothetical protein